MIRVVAFYALLLFCLTPWCSPPIALALGLALALTLGNPYKTGKITKLLLQISVVGLGFGMNLQKVVEAGRTGVLFTIATIAGTSLSCAMSVNPPLLSCHSAPSKAGFKERTAGL